MLPNIVTVVELKILLVKNRQFIIDFFSVASIEL